MSKQSCLECTVSLRYPSQKVAAKKERKSKMMYIEDPLSDVFREKSISVTSSLVYVGFCDVYKNLGSN